MSSITIRERIYQHMLYRGITQTVICTDLGMQMPNFNAFIRGKRTISFKDLVNILNYLHLTVAPVGAEFAVVPPESMNETFRKSIKCSGMKISEIESASGICSSSIYRIIKGKLKPSSRNLGKLMAVLGLDIVPYKKK